MTFQRRLLFSVGKMSPYKRKSHRKLVFTKPLIKQIRPEIAEGKLKRKIAIELNIPEATLRKLLKCGTIPRSLGPFKCAFTEMETQLAELVRELRTNKLF